MGCLFLSGNAFTNDQVALSRALVCCGMQVIPKYLCPNSGLAFNLGRNFTALGGSLIAKYRKQGRAGREASVSYSVNTLVRKAAIWLSIKRIELYLGIELKSHKEACPVLGLSLSHSAMLLG